MQYGKGGKGIVITTKVCNEYKTFLYTILKHIHFQYNDSYYKPSKDVAMDSPVSGLTAEILLQYY
jgi:hypothetical protein